MSLAEVFIGGVVIGWLALTVITQFASTRWSQRIRARDPAALLPIWTFFAPNPGVSDHFLLCRDVRADGSHGPWRPPFAPRSSRVRMVWHPGKRIDKLVSDSAGLLATSTAWGQPDMALEVPHLILQRMAEESEHDALAVAYQFGLFELNAYHTTPEARCVLRSAAIPVDHG